MASTSDIGSRINTQSLLLMLRGKLNDTQRIASSGKKSSTLADLGSMGAANAISYRSKIKVISGYTDNLNLAKTKLTVMDKSMGSITDAARDTLTFLRSQLQGSAPQGTIVAGQASNSLQTVISQLNIQVNGQYQFSGDALYTAPMATPGSLDTNVGGLVPGFLAGAPTASSVVTAARAVTTANLGYSNGTLTAGNVSFRGDDAVDIDYTVNGAQQGFADILRGLSLIKNLPQPTTQSEQNNYWAVVNGAIQLLDEGAKAVDRYQGTLGNTASYVDSLLTQHSEVEGTYEEFVGSIEDADVAEAATKLQMLQTQLEASYSMVGQLKGLSLINFL